MIIHLKQGVEENKAKEIADELKAIHFMNGKHVLVTSSSKKEVDSKYSDFIDESFVFQNDIQLASNEYSEKRTIDFGNFSIGGSTNNTLMITGPCSVESREQIDKTAKFVADLGIKVLRAGAFKPRTSPYSFQGLGIEGLQLLAEMREKYGLKIISEVKDATHIDAIIDHVDIVQIGAKAMYDHGILRRCSEIQKPILIKRGFGTTLQEFVQAAEFVLSGGNPNVILCERGIRTFETKTRFTLDLCGAAYLKHNTNLPVVLDPSHAMGYAYGVPDLTLACTAMGIDGLLIETHPTPKTAKSDAAQQLDFESFENLLNKTKLVANAVGRNLI